MAWNSNHTENKIYYLHQNGFDETFSWSQQNFCDWHKFIWFNLIMVENSVWINPNSDWKLSLVLLKLMLWIELDQVRLIFYRFSSNEIQHVFRIGSKWLGMVQKQIPEWLWFAGNKVLLRRQNFLINRTKYPWLNYWIEIISERISAIPNH